MKVIYNEVEDEVKINWNEGKKSKLVRHSFSGEASVLQLHPKNENVVVRAYFDGKIPGWMYDYKRTRPSGYKTGSANVGDGTLGWWVSCWNKQEAGHTMFMCPTINGAIYMLADHLPEELKHYKEDLLSNLDMISLNLQFDANYFKSFGLHYRPEEIKGVAGALLIDNNVLLDRNKDESNQEYATRLEQDGNLLILITEMITPNEYDGNDDSEDDEETVCTSSSLDEEELQPIEYEEDDNDEEFQPIVYDDDAEEPIATTSDDEEHEPIVYEDIADDSIVTTTNDEEHQPIVYEDIADDPIVTTTNAEEFQPVVYEDIAEEPITSTIIGDVEETIVIETHGPIVTDTTPQEVSSCNATTINIVTSSYKNAVPGQLTFF